MIGFAITASIILAAVVSTQGVAPAALMSAVGVAVIAARWEFLSDDSLSRPREPGAGPLVLPAPERAPESLARPRGPTRATALLVLARVCVDPGFHGRAAALCQAYGLVSLLVAFLQEMFFGSAEVTMRGMLVYWAAALAFGAAGILLKVAEPAKPKSPRPPLPKRAP